MILEGIFLATMTALAPHPICFSVDGRPSVDRMEIEGHYYEAKWDGHKMFLNEYFPPKKPPEEIFWERFFYGMGCLLPFMASAFLMIWLIIKISLFFF